MREIREAYAYIPRRMLELTGSGLGLSDKDATAIVAEEITELRNDTVGQALLAAESLPSPLAARPSPGGRWVVQFLLTLGYGILIILWNTGGAIAVAYFVSES